MVDCHVIVALLWEPIYLNAHSKYLSVQTSTRALLQYYNMFQHFKELQSSHSILDKVHQNISSLSRKKGLL